MQTPVAVRGDARKSVAKKWANRKQQQAEIRNGKHTQSKDSHSLQQMSSLSPSSSSRSFLPLCVILRKSWNEALKGFQSGTGNTQRQRTVSQSPSTSNTNRRASFPSVLSILQANELKHQVESFQDYDPTILSVLPKDYDFHQAIHDMSQSRSRVFLLLDLAAMVQSHVYWRKKLPKTVQMVFSLRHNANPKLIQVLHRLGVGMQVSTKYELNICRQTLFGNNNDILGPRKTPKIVIWDDATSLSKPNSFYRSLILENQTSDTEGCTPLAVNGPDEIERLVAMIENLARRRNQEIPSLNFTLKMPSSKLSKKGEGQCRQLLKDSYNTAKRLRYSLVGISLELPKEGLEDFFDRLTHLLEYIRGSLYLPNCQIHLTCLAPAIDPMVLEWLNHYHAQQVDSSVVTLDVSHLLVANAGALCTRIIGVKQNEPGKIHYYIDDGCYGSLSKDAASPMPLQSRNERNDSDDDSKRQEQLLATVWGPTCDGLDKVCSDISLPKLSRDDWLVFGDLGFCQVGTSFNGFAPPDIAYCVLGGYLHQSSSAAS